MKQISASEARRNWFRILDEVAAGHVVVVERNGRLIELRRQAARGATADTPDYSRVLRVPDAGEADLWGWTRPGTEKAMPTKRRTR